MSVTCTHCQRTAEPSDAFCFYCGSQIRRRRIVADDDYFPVPGVVGQPDLRIRRRRRRRPWYRKPLPAFFAVLAALIILASASAIFLRPSASASSALGSLSNTASSVVLNVVRISAASAHGADALGVAVMQGDKQLLVLPLGQDVA